MRQRGATEKQREALEAYVNSGCADLCQLRRISRRKPRTVSMIFLQIGFEFFLT